MSITPLPTPPQTTDPANFDSRADAWVSALQNWTTQANALSVSMNAREASATSAATTATAAATAAQAAQVLSQALGAYKGAWSTLTGALAIPASVLHNGVFWALTATLANVTTATPGVSSSWIPVVYPGGTDPDQQPRNRELGSAAYLNQTWLHASATFDPGSVANGAQTTTTVAVPGAVFGDFVLPPSLSISAAGMQVSGYIDAANSVTLIYQNTSGGSIDLASHTVFVRLMKRLPE
jgi:hypothetical protein